MSHGSLPWSLGAHIAPETEQELSCEVCRFSASGPQGPFCSVQRVLFTKDKKDGHFPFLEMLLSLLTLDFPIFPVRLC